MGHENIKIIREGDHAAQKARRIKAVTDPPPDRAGKNRAVPVGGIHAVNTGSRGIGGRRVIVRGARGL